ncbi:hypothetical protein [Streptomyces sp. NPDC102360]
MSIPRGHAIVPADLDRFVNETIDLTDVRGAFDRMSRGEVLRPVVRP